MRSPRVCDFKTRACHPQTPAALCERPRRDPFCGSGCEAPGPHAVPVGFTLGCRPHLLGRSVRSSGPGPDTRLYPQPRPPLLNSSLSFSANEHSRRPSARPLRAGEDGAALGKGTQGRPALAWAPWGPCRDAAGPLAGGTSRRNSSVYQVDPLSPCHRRVESSSGASAWLEWPNGSAPGRPGASASPGRSPAHPSLPCPVHPWPP